MKSFQLIHHSWWLLAANGDGHDPVVEAQTALAFYYSRKSSFVYDLKKAWYWHNQAAQRGSLESLGNIELISVTDMIDD